ncbi:hypothetical protein [Ferruginibacter sp.]|nr:hypothetical protein [Ferruginibacter sp.]
MKTTFIVLFFSGLLLINLSCKKDNTGNNGPVSTDPAVLILGKWQVIKDSIVVHNFAFSDGTIPIPGVYFGTANDHWLFQTNSTVYIYEGGALGTFAYQLPSSSRLLIPSFAWGDISILKLTSTNFIWEKSITSSNGGTYYRRAYLKK